MAGNIIVCTLSGSTYELDCAHQLIRRLAGYKPPTVRQGADGAWQPYALMSEPCLGQRLMVVWCVDNMARCTVTSPVTVIASAAE